MKSTVKRSSSLSLLPKANFSRANAKGNVATQQQQVLDHKIGLLLLVYRVLSLQSDYCSLQQCKTIIHLQPFLPPFHACSWPNSSPQIAYSENLRTSRFQAYLYYLSQDYCWHQPKRKEGKLCKGPIFQFLSFTTEDSKKTLYSISKLCHDYQNFTLFFFPNRFCTRKKREVNNNQKEV